MGRTIYIPTLNDTTDFASDTINAIPQESTVDTFADFNFETFESYDDHEFSAVDYVNNHVEEQVDFRINEAIAWDARDAFIQSVAAKVFYIVPAFIVGLMAGVFLWALYIFFYKMRIRYCKTTNQVEPEQQNRQELTRSNSPSSSKETISNDISDSSKDDSTMPVIDHVVTPIIELSEDNVKFKSKSLTSQCERFITKESASRRDGL